MNTVPICTCLPGATLWLEGSATHAVAVELADRLRARHHRRVEVLHTEAAEVPEGTAAAAVRRIGMLAEVLARNGILAVVVSATEEAADRDVARIRHQRAGTAFLQVPAADSADPAPAVDTLLALLAEHGLILPG